MWSAERFKASTASKELRGSNCIILIGGLKFGNLVVSIVERYLIQCPLFRVSVKRDSTVVPRRSSITKH